MKTIRLVALGAVLLCGGRAPAEIDLPAAAKEVLKQYERFAADYEKSIEAKVLKRREKTVADLKQVQDLLCKEAKLDEAVAVRDLIRCLRSGSNNIPSDLPPAAREIYKQHEEEMGELVKNAEFGFEKCRYQMTVDLKKVQDELCKEAKLDEAVAVRDLIRAIRDGVTNTLADPGYVNNGAEDIGKVYYYTVTGAITGGAIYGTDVFTTGSHLAMAAVHSNVLKDGQKGVVKVTILPGQESYAATTRNGITSHAWRAYHVSFKVERVFGFVAKLPVIARPDKAP